MADFEVYNSVMHPIITVEDHRYMCDHAFEKSVAYIVRVNGGVYEAIKGGTSSNAGQIIYGGADNAGGVDGTDAAAVIQAANTAGDTLIKAGSYAISSPVVLAHSLYGEGWDTALTGDTESALTMFKIDSDFLTVANLGMNGGGYFYATLTVGDGADNTRILNCYLHGGYDRVLWVWDEAGDTPTNVLVDGCYIGPRTTNDLRPGITLDDPSIDISQCEGFIITNCLIEGDLSTGAYTYPLILCWADAAGGTYKNWHGTFANNIIRRHDESLMRIAGGRSIKILGNQIYDGKVGIELFSDGVADSNRDILISGNSIYNMQLLGIAANKARDVTITDNYINNTNIIAATWPAVNLEDCLNCIVSGNTILASYQGIVLYTSDYNHVCNNLIRDCDEQAIILYTSDHNSITTNNLKTDTDDIFLTTGASYNFIAHNFCLATVGNGIYIQNGGGDCENNRIVGNYAIGIAEGGGTAAGNTFRGNYPDGFNENCGTATIASGTVAQAVTHGCGYTPLASDIIVTQTAATTNPCYITEIDTIGAVTFTVHCSADPGVSGLAFGWRVQQQTAI